MYVPNLLVLGELTSVLVNVKEQRGQAGLGTLGRNSVVR